MMDALFGFRGRLGRLAFLGWNLAGMALVLAAVVAFLVLGAGLSIFLSQINGAAKLLGAVTGLTCAIGGIWMTLALAAKRIRDIGLAPLPVMIGTTMLLALDHYVLTHLTEVRFFPPFTQHTPLGGFLATAWTVFLFCWPGASGASEDAPRDHMVPADRLDRAQFGRRK